MGAPNKFERFHKVRFYFCGEGDKYYQADFLDTEYMPIFAGISMRQTPMDEVMAYPEHWDLVPSTPKAGRADIWVGCMCTKMYVDRVVRNFENSDMQETYILTGCGLGPSQNRCAPMTVTLYTHPDVTRLSARYSALRQQAKSLDKEMHEVETTLARLRTIK